MRAETIKRQTRATYGCTSKSQWLGAPWVGEQQTRSWPNCTDHHEALIKTSNCAFRAKKWRGTTKKNFSGALRRIGAPPTFAPDWCRPPHFQTRFGATAPMDPLLSFLVRDWLLLLGHPERQQQAKVADMQRSAAKRRWGVSVPGVFQQTKQHQSATQTSTQERA